MILQNQSNKQEVSKNTQALWVHALDYIVHREVAKKLAEEQAADEVEGQIFDLPFKMKM
jgi:hypothetical protein